MTDDWIINVLADLRKFAQDNSMGNLVKQLDDTIHIAETEIAPDIEFANITDCPSEEKFRINQASFIV